MTVVLVVTVVVKGILCAWCQRIAAKTGSSSVAAYAEDHFNDTITNAAGACALGVTVWRASLWWMDPLAGALIALFIIMAWVDTAGEQIRFLIGETGNPDLLCELTFVACVRRGGGKGGGQRPRTTQSLGFRGPMLLLQFPAR